MENKDLNLAGAVDLSVLTPEEKQKDSEARKEAFRAKMVDLVKEFQVAPEAVMQYTNMGVYCGLTLVDLKTQAGVTEHLPEEKNAVEIKPEAK